MVIRNDDLSSSANSLSAQIKNNFSEMTDASWSHVLTDSSKEETRTVAVCRAIYPQVNYFVILFFFIFNKFIDWFMRTYDLMNTRRDIERNINM